MDMLARFYYICNTFMRVIARRALIEFFQQYPDSKGQLESWYKEALYATWRKPQEIKDKFKTASFVGSNRVVFNIGGNKYRLIVKVEYEIGLVFIRFIGTHREYDKIDAGVV